MAMRLGDSGVKNAPKAIKRRTMHHCSKLCAHPTEIFVLLQSELSLDVHSLRVGNPPVPGSYGVLCIPHVSIIALALSLHMRSPSRTKADQIIEELSSDDSVLTASDLLPTASKEHE